jgi:hypothetical protein
LHISTGISSPEPAPLPVTTPASIGRIVSPEIHDNKTERRPVAFTFHPEAKPEALTTSPAHSLAPNAPMSPMHHHDCPHTPLLLDHPGTSTLGSTAFLLKINLFFVGGCCGGIVFFRSNQKKSRNFN